MPYLKVKTRTMKNTEKNKKKVNQSQGAEMTGLVHALARNRTAGIAELTKIENAIRVINIKKRAMSADKRAGFLLEEVVAGTYNASARKAGDFETTAITGSSGGFSIDPRVDIRVVRRGKVIAEAQAKCCASSVRTAVAIANPKYEGTQRIVPAEQTKSVQKMLVDSAKRKAGSNNLKMRATGLARKEAASKATDRLNANGHTSRPVSHREAIQLANGNTSKISHVIAMESLKSAAVGGAKAGAAIGVGIGAISSACGVVKGSVSGKEALVNVATCTAAGGARSMATNVVAEGVKVVVRRSLPKATAATILRGAAPLAVAGCMMDIASDACNGRLTIKNTARNVTRAAGAWAGAEGGAMFGSALCPGIGTLIGGVLGGMFGSLLCGFW